MLEKRLLTVGPYTLSARHLLVIAVLSLSFTISMLIRAQPAEHGLELFEFDPFFNYRATSFLIENGLDGYADWHDELSWYPTGRDVSKTSQFMQHATAASLYGVFGGGSDLKDFVTVLPMVMGALTGIAVFALVRVIAGTTAGLLASLFYAVSLPIIIRGMIGWFKAEPIGLFYAVIGIYLFLSGITCARRKEAAIRLAGAAIVLSLALSAWGGVQFFVIPLGLFFMALPFVRRDHSFLIWAVPLFAAVFLATTAMFERPGPAFVLGLGGASLAGSAAIMAACMAIWRISADGRGARNSLILILATAGAAGGILAAGSAAESLDLPSFRYLNAVNPFLTSTDPLVDSIAEHAPVTVNLLFYYLSTLMVFAGIGIWLLFSGRERLDSYGMPLRTDMVVYAMIMSIVGLYISSTFTRLVLFSSLAMVVMASIGLAILASLIFSHKRARIRTKSGFVAAVVVILAVPLILPYDNNWVVHASSPPTILNGGNLFDVTTGDWPDAMEWLRTETPEDSVILSWWDYGYWIETLAERATLVDNLTISTTRIQGIAQILYSEPDEAWESIREIGADYVLIYVAANNVSATSRDIYTLSGGGDELKKIWIARIAEHDESEYFYDDSLSPREKFNETIFGQMIPFSHITYVHVESGLKSVKWQPGFEAVYEKDVKLPADGDGPLRLVYASPSFEEEVDSIISGILIYEVNDGYVPAAAPAELPDGLGIAPFLDTNAPADTAEAVLEDEIEAVLEDEIEAVLEDEAGAVLEDAEEPEP